MYSTKEVGERLGLAQRTIERWCLILKFRKIGRDYVLTEIQLQEIAVKAQRRRGWVKGRPRKKGK